MITSNVATIMRQKKITYEELQFLAQAAPDTIARARDRRIASCTLGTLEKLAMALHVHVAELFSYLPENEEKNT